MGKLENETKQIELQMDREFFENPYPTYARYRENSPVSFDETTGTWMAFSHSAVGQALFDPKRFSSSRGNVIQDSPHRVGKTLGSMDPPQHDRLKPMILMGFKADRIASTVQSLLADADKRLEEFEPGVQIDFVKDFSRPLLYSALGRMLGFSDDASLRLSGMLDNLFHSSEDPAGAPLPPEDFAKLFSMFGEQLEYRRNNPDDDLFSILIESQKAKPELTDEFIIANMSTVLLAGNASIGHYFPNIIHALFHHPIQHQHVVHEPSLIPALIEETVRWDTSTQCFARHITQDTELDGVSLPKDSRLVLFYAAANRDNMAIENAEHFDIHRHKTRHFGFGGGVHHCLGAMTSRRFLIPLLEKLLPKIAEFELDLNNAERVKHLMARGFRSLPMTIIRSK